MRRLALMLLVICAAFAGRAVAEEPTTPSPSPAPGVAADPAAPPDAGPVAVPPATEKALRYYESGNVLWTIDVVLGFLIPSAFLFTGFSARLRDLSRRIGRNWFFTLVIYFVLFSLITFVIGLPWSYYTEFVRQHDYGLSNQTLGKWLGDSLKGLLVGLVMGALFLWVPFLLLKRFPRRWWLYTSILAVPFLFLMIVVAPIWIDPLFNEFGPMKDRGLEQQILALADRAGIEGSRVFEVNKSVDTKAVNAYVTGFFGTKRIVLWDTIIAKLTTPELLGVMGHEMGHYVLGHVPSTVAFLAGLILVTLYLAERTAGYFFARHSRRMGFDSLADIAALPLLILLTNLFSFLVSPVALAYSRHHEHEADRFALEITRDNHVFGTAFVKLQTENLGNPRPGLLYKLWRASHPPIGERIDFCNEYRPWERGEPLRYEKLFKSAPAKAADIHSEEQGEDAMTERISRRQFVKTGATVGALAAGASPLFGQAPTVLVRKATPPVVIASANGNEFKNGGPRTGVAEAYERIVKGEDVLAALIAGVNIVELDPLDDSVGYGGLPNAEGVVQLDSCCMHGPKRRAGAVAALEGVRTPSLVAHAVSEQTDHHLLVGHGAQDFARKLGFKIEDDLNTENSRRKWLEWKRRLDPGHYLDPAKRVEAEDRARRRMMADGLLDPFHAWGTINCDGVGPKGDVCGVTTTSGLAWKIPGRVGDSPILGAGLYVAGDVGAAGSTGRGEANLFNLSSFFIVEEMRRGASPKDAGMAALKRVVKNTVEKRLLDPNGNPRFHLQFYALNRSGEYAGVSLYAKAGNEVAKFAVCTEKGPETLVCDALLGEGPAD